MKKGEGPALAKKHGVTTYPTLFLVNHRSKVEKHTTGYHNASQLIQLGQQALK